MIIYNYVRRELIYDSTKLILISLLYSVTYRYLHVHVVLWSSVVQWNLHIKVTIGEQWFGCYMEVTFVGRFTFI